MESSHIYSNINTFSVVCFFICFYSFIACIYYCLWLTCSVYFDLNPEHINAGDFNTKPIEITINFTGGFQYKESINEQQGGKMANFDNHIFQKGPKNHNTHVLLETLAKQNIHYPETVTTTIYMYSNCVRDGK